jgi:uncharacterized glyoxalase superfamily protein PhnB
LVDEGSGGIRELRAHCEVFHRADLVRSKWARAAEFYKSAFGAVEVFRIEDPSGAVVCRLSVEGADPFGHHWEIGHPLEEHVV